MTAAVGPTIAAPTGPAASRAAARETETGNERFGDALDRAGPRSGRHPIRDAETSQHRWHRHSADTATTKRTGDVPIPQPDAEAGTLDVAADADLPAATGADTDDVDADDTDVDTVKSEDGGRPDAGLPAHMRAHHTISAMMAMPPARFRHSADGDAAHAPQPGQTIVGARAGMAAGTESQAAREGRAATSNASVVQSDAKGTAAASIAMPATAVAPDGSDAPVKQTQQMGASPEGRGVPTGPDARTAVDVARPSRTQDASGDQHLRVTPSQAATSQVQVTATATSDGAGRFIGGSRGERDASPAPRRGEPQPAPPRVTVLSQQAAPAPVAGLAPVWGVNTGAIVSAISAQHDLRPVPGVPAMPGSMTAQPVRSLKVQLHPAELGVVTANLKATGEQLSVELQVESQEAYHRLSADSDAIVKSLRAIGYDIDRVSILQPQAAATATARSDISGGGSFSRDSSSLQSGNSGGGGDRAGGQTNGRGDRGDAQGGGEAQQAYRNRPGSGIYI